MSSSKPLLYVNHILKDDLKNFFACIFLCYMAVVRECRKVPVPSSYCRAIAIREGKKKKKRRFSRGAPGAILCSSGGQQDHGGHGAMNA